MTETTNKLAIIKQEFETSVYDNNIVWEEGEMVWMCGTDGLLGHVTICKSDKPFTIYVHQNQVEEFKMEWVKLR